MRKIKRKTAPEGKTIVLDRLARLDGQVRALRRLVETSDDFKKILVLCAAIQGASDQVTADLYRCYLETLTENTAIAAKAREGLELVLRRR